MYIQNRGNFEGIRPCETWRVATGEKVDSIGPKNGN